MTIRDVVCVGNGLDVFEPVISVDGMKLIIEAGEFTHEGQSVVLDERVEYEILTVDERISLTAWLVRRKSTGEITILVDERLPGVGVYLWDDDDLEQIFAMSHVLVPAGATNLDSPNVDITVQKIVRQS